MPLVQITGHSNGAYLEQHLAIIKENIGRSCQVDKYDRNYYRTTSAMRLMFLIHKDDCIVMSTY